MNYFLNLDLLGEKPKLRINNSFSYKNYLGSSISLAIICLSVTVIIYFSIQIFERTKSNIVFSVLNTNTPPPILLTSNNFSIAVAMEDLNFNYYIDDSIYKVSAIAKYGVLNNETWIYNDINLNLSRCHLDNFPQNYRSLLNEKSLQNMLCIDKSSSFLFNGTFPSGKILEIFVFLSECKNSTSNNFSCKPRETIDKMLDGNFLEIFYTELSIDPSNMTNPNQVLIGDLFRTVSNKYVTNIVQSIKNVIIESDYGYLYESVHRETFVQTDQIITSYVFSSGYDYYTSYMIQLSPVINIYKRSYAKAQDIAAQIGGVVNFLLIFGTILMRNLRKAYFYCYLSNIIFEFQNPISIVNLKNMKNPKLSSDRYKIEKDLTAKSNNFFEEKSVDVTQMKKNDDNDPKYSISFDFRDVLLIIFCKCIKKFQNKKLSFLEESKIYVDNFLNLETLIQNYQDIEKIKKILFDFHQLRLINIPLKHVVRGYEIRSFLEKNESLGLDNQKVQESYQVVMKRKNFDISNFDNKILNLIHSNIDKNSK